MYKKFLGTAAAGVVVSAAAVCRADNSQPNIVFIFADDMGYGDVKCNNPEGKIPTPNIDKLAQQGMRFTDAHAAASVCTPSRYALLTGRYPWRTELKRGVLATTRKGPGDTIGAEPLIKKDILTVGAFLKQNGYDTAAFGKWHLGLWYKFPEGQKLLKGKEKGSAAAPVGTEVVEGPITKGFDIFRGYHHAREMGTWISQDKVTENIKPIQMLGKITDSVIEYINDPARKKKPFFIYIPLNSPHAPILPVKDWEGKSGINIYADYVMETDNMAGRIITALDKAGFKDNTVVFFSSDNGCSHKANFKELLAAGHHTSGIFRGHKADIWEGGHRVPFIVRWPGVVKPGSVCSDPICLASFLSTTADILGKKLPGNAGVDSFSILPDLRNPDNKTPTHKLIIHQSSKGKLAVRDGEWKFIACSGSGGWTAGGDDKPLQLYNMVKDCREHNNLIDAMPEIAEKLKKELETGVSSGATVPGRAGANDTPVVIFTRSVSGKNANKGGRKKK